MLAKGLRRGAPDVAGPPELLLELLLQPASQLAVATLPAENKRVCRKVRRDRPLRSRSFRRGFIMVILNTEVNTLSKACGIFMTGCGRAFYSKFRVYVLIDR